MNDEKQRDDEAAAAVQPEEPEAGGQPEAALADEAPAADAEQPTEEAADEAVEEAPEEEVESAEAETDEVDEAAEAPASQPARRRASQRDQAPEGIPALFGRKLGMLQVFDESGAVQNVTALELGPCVVTMVRTPQRDGYSAVQLGWGQSRSLSKPAAGHLAPSDGEFRHLREVRVEDSASFGVGQQVTASIFQPGERVDVTSTSKGRGFAGGVKRHGFHGGPKTHGQSDRHRAPGSIGAGTTPGHVLKGQKMAGHMGARQVTVRSLVVVKSDDEKNLLLVRGSVPGPINGLVRVKRTTRAVAK
jgi:large subunit ribosomal protein L3